MRWSLVLSRYNFCIIHVSSTKNGRADALSQRDQDMLKNAQDDWLREQNVQLIKPEWISKGHIRVVANRPRITPVALRNTIEPEQDILLEPEQAENKDLGELYPLLADWPEAV